MVPPGSVRVSRVRTYSGTLDSRPCSFVYGTIALFGARFHTLRLPHDFVTAARPATAWNKCPTTPDTQRVAAYTHPVWADPFSLATTQGVEVSFLSSGYLDVSVPQLAFRTLCIQVRIPAHYHWWVSPFGDPGVKGWSAPHPGLSQPPTSFIGSWRQGIHRVPLVS